MKKKTGIIIGITAAVTVVAVTGVAVVTLTVGGIAGGLAIKNGKLGLPGFLGSNTTVTGLPSNATIVTPGPSGTMWDSSMEYAINVPESVFESKDGTISSKPMYNHTQWINYTCGGIPGPYADVISYMICDNETYIHNDYLDIRNMGNGCAIWSYIRDDQDTIPYLYDKAHTGYAYLGHDNYIFDRYGPYTDTIQTPLVFVDDCAYFISFSGDYSNWALPGYTPSEAFKPDEIFLTKLDPNAEGNDEDPVITRVKLDEVGLVLQGGSFKPSTDRIKLAADNGKVYIMNYIYNENRAFVLYIYDTATGSMDRKECVLEFDMELMKPLIDNGFIVEEDVLYMVYNTDYLEKVDVGGGYYDHKYYTQMGVFSYDLNSEKTKKNDEFGIKTYILEEYEYNEYLYDRSYKGSLCKNNDGIFFENDEGILFRRRGESNTQIVYSNTYYIPDTRYHNLTTAEYPECCGWNVGDGWIYYSDCEIGVFDSRDKSTWKPEDYLIHRVNYNTGEEQTICIFQLLMYGTFAQITSDPNESYSDVDGYYLEDRFVIGIAGNTSVIHALGDMESVEIKDDGTIVLYNMNYETHEMEIHEFDQSAQYAIP